MLHHIDRYRQRFRYTLAAAASVCILLALLIGAAIQRVRVEQALQESHAELEVRVKQRTEQIARANEALLLEIEERKKTEQELLDYQRRLRSLSTELIQTQMQERRLIAREIHDGVGQALALVKIKLGGLQAALGAGKASETVKEIRDIVIQTIRDTRTLTFELSPPILYELGLQVALEWLAEFIRKQSGLRIIVKGDGADRNLNTQQRVFLFRAVRELLYNIVKHAGATKAKVRIDGRPEGILVEVADNGSGFDTRVLAEKKKEPESGFSLFSIREQLQYYGGRLEINSGPGKGTRMIMSLPLKA
jgi:signal transduction histidine kinase